MSGLIHEGDVDHQHHRIVGLSHQLQCLCPVTLQSMTDVLSQQTSMNVVSYLECQYQPIRGGYYVE